ncbi:PHB depolymerase family esterase [uncultured Tateyamaria sp.]|uniref:extracellular catalytic domain type 1 short-chain-length polyhydroxyalkanoate depolymerase n=1 Tax=uncultured Tateyamaria sp. TaxID=455651 RepID=UPI00262BBC34|nr:PHB depolymerase family esterase [uncultured Tateyamaria sp.]
MKLFDIGAWRPATDDARLSAANDLVQRTLARHGLAPQSGTAQPGGIAMDDMLARLSQLHSPTAAAQPKIPEGAQFLQNTYACDAGTRAYWIYTPTSALEGATGVVMMLHGCTQTPVDFAAGTGMNRLADQNGFVVIYPAQSRGDNAQSCWNWFSRGDQRRGRGEPAILAGLAAQVAADHGVDKEQTFVAGLSAGGAMAAILGETYPDVFAAVGAHSGLPVGAAKDVPSAFAAMGGTVLEASGKVEAGSGVRTVVFHGSADATVHPKNGDRIVQRAMDVVGRQSVETTERGAENGRTYTRKIIRNDTGVGMVEHWRIDGQGHAWSGGAAAGSYTDPQGPDASAEMIRFFFGAAAEVG